MDFRISEIRALLKNTFHKVIKNIVSLGDDSTLEADPKPLKIGEKNTSISLSETEVNVDGSINVEEIYVGNPHIKIGSKSSTNSIIEAESGLLKLNSSDVSLSSGKGLYFDAGSDTYIYESSADVLRIIVGGDIIFHIVENGDDGNTIKVDGSIGFDQKEPSYDASNTECDFRHGNKQFITFGSGNITNMKLTFPTLSGNYILLLKQDGSGSRTVTNWKVMEEDESAADGENAVKWAGGSAPTLTTDANHVDILSFYYDADNEIAYGVATLDFQF